MATRLTGTGGTGIRGPAQQKLVEIRCWMFSCGKGPWTCSQKPWGLTGNRSHPSSYLQSVQVRHHHLCHQGDHLAPKQGSRKEQEGVFRAQIELSRASAGVVQLVFMSLGTILSYLLLRTLATANVLCQTLCIAAFV